MKQLRAFLELNSAPETVYLRKVRRNLRALAFSRCRCAVSARLKLKDTTRSSMFATTTTVTGELHLLSAEQTLRGVLPSTLQTATVGTTAATANHAEYASPLEPHACGYAFVMHCSVSAGLFGKRRLQTFTHEQIDVQSLVCSLACISLFLLTDICRHPDSVCAER